MNLNPIEHNPAFELTRRTTGGVNLVPSHHWARNFSVSDDDIDYLTGLLLERETPLSSADLARALIEHRLNEQTAALQEQYKNVRFYNPALSYEVGQKLMFPALDYRMAVVTAVRPGNNPEYGAFQVMQVEFDDESKGGSRPREFAHSLSTSHKLAEEAEARIRACTPYQQLAGLDLAGEGQEHRARRILEPRVGDHHVEDRRRGGGHLVPHADRLEQPPAGRDDGGGARVAARPRGEGRIGDHDGNLRAQSLAQRQRQPQAGEGASADDDAAL